MKSRFLLAFLCLGFASPVAGQSNPPPLTAADEVAIRAALEEWCAAALAGDLERWSSVYSPQGIEVFESGQSNVSRANIAVRVRGFFANGKFTRCVNNVSAIQGTGNTAVMVHAMEQDWVNTESQQATKYAYNNWTLLKKETDGKWRILVTHWVARR